MEVCVTGASGFIGTALANLLAERGHGVRALLRTGARDAGLAPAVQRIFGSWDDPAFLARAVAGCAGVVHLAGAVRAPSAAAFNAVNQGLARKLALAMRAAAPRAAVLHVSSQAAGGPCAEPPGLDESRPAAPVSDYGRSKLLGEAEALGLAQVQPVAVVRPSMVYGPGDRAFVPLYGLARHGVLPAPGRTEQPFSIVCVEDLAAGLALALEALAGGGLASGSLYYLDGPETTDWRGYARSLGRVLGRNVRALALPVWVLRLAALGNESAAWFGLPSSHLTLDKVREGSQAGWLCSHARAARDFGYAPRLGLEQGLARTIPWCRKEGLL
jgi:nucleoside-diphosphate-sugar epimerase